MQTYARTTTTQGTTDIIAPDFDPEPLPLDTTDLDTPELLASFAEMEDDGPPPAPTPSSPTLRFL